MKVHYLQHVPFERIGAIEDWVQARGHALSGSEMFRVVEDPSEDPDNSPGRSAPEGDAEVPQGPALPGSDRLPDLDEVDLLVVMGGPMNVDDSERHPWLETEKGYIAAAVAAGRRVLGICLGAQLLAQVLGASVTRNVRPEIGWYPVTLTEAGRAVPIFADVPDRFTALHWHGDTFAIPPGAVHAASSEACASQAFSYDGGRVVGLQFHLEETPESLALLVENAAGDLASANDEPWVAGPDDLLTPDAPYEECRKLLFRLLDRMTA